MGAFDTFMVTMAGNHEFVQKLRGIFAFYTSKLQTSKQATTCYDNFDA